jgi:hypothetical protein
MVAPARSRSLERTLLSDAAIDERIDLALGALAPGRSRPRAAAAKKRRSA